MKNLKKYFWIFMEISVALFQGACTNNFSSPLFPRIIGLNAACSGTAFNAIPSPNRAILAVGGPINISGSNLLTDSYKSASGPYGGANIFAHGDIQSFGVINISGVGTTVSGSQYQNMPSSLSIANPPTKSSGNLSYSGIGQTYTFSAGDYYYDSINISGSSIALATSGGQVRIWFNIMNLSGTNLTIGNSTPSNLWFLGTCGATYSASPNSMTCTAVIYNPSGPVNDSGVNETYYGAIIGSTINMSGVNNNIHRDESL